MSNAASARNGRRNTALELAQWTADRHRIRLRRLAQRRSPRQQARSLWILNRQMPAYSTRV